jgi:hypothetical protein
MSARFIDRLPCERNGTSDFLLEPLDDVDGVAAHEGRVRPVEGSLQRGRHHRRRHAPHPGGQVGQVGPAPQQLQEGAKGVGPEDHPLLGVVQGEAVVEQLGALLAPIAAPVAVTVVRPEAVEGGEDVEGVGRGHDALLEGG